MTYLHHTQPPQAHHYFFGAALLQVGAASIVFSPYPLRSVS